MLTRCLLIAACFCSFTASVCADPTADARKGIQASLDALDATEKTQNNILAPSDVYAPGYTAITDKGQVVTLKDFRKMTAAAEQNYKRTHAHVVIASLRQTIQTLALQGSGATVTYNRDLVMTISVPGLPHPTTQHISNMVISVWKQYGSRWRMERSTNGHVTVRDMAPTGNPTVTGSSTATGAPLKRVLGGTTSLSNNKASETDSSEKVAKQFFQNVGAGKLEAAKSEVIPFPHPGDPVADVAGYVKTHGAITNVAFAFADTRQIGKAGLLCELTFADNSKKECQLILYKIIPNTTPIPLFRQNEQQRHDVLTKGKWYVNQTVFSY